MFDRSAFARIVGTISQKMSENRDRLVELDQVNGDGDLGISMDDGFRALAAFAQKSDEGDLGQLLREAAKVLNQSAPSSLGTILSFGLMGMAKSLRGVTSADFAQSAQALRDGLENIMAKAESKPGEKTILDSLHPGVEVLLKGSADDIPVALQAAADAAAAGSEGTREMRAVHGRAAYTAERSIGILDGGSVVGRLIFEGIAEAGTA